MYVFSVFFPIVLTNIIFYNVTVDNVKEQKLHDSTLVLAQIKKEFLESIDDAVGVSASLYTNNLVNEFLEKEYQSPSEYIESYDTYFRGFNKYGPLSSSIKNIQFYTDNPTVFYSGGISLLSDYVQEAEWFKKFNEKGRSLPVIAKTSRDTFSIIRELNYFYVYNTTRKIVKIDLNLDTIDHIFTNVTFQGYVYLVNDKDIIEYSTDPNVNWKEHSIKIDAIPLPKGVQVLEETFNDVNYLNDWRVIGVLTDGALLDEVKDSRRFIIYLAFFNFIVPTLIIILISRSLHSRLIRIAKHMKRMENQRFDTIQGIEYKDEIGQMTSEFNRMSRKIKELINDVYVANIQKKDLELQKKQAQLSALQSQINPHFLFNALETIRMRSLMKQEQETAKIIQNMAKILRRSFTWGKDWVSVEEEMNLVTSFLEIQHYRFGDKLEYVIDVDPAVSKFTIPNMSILPFVENASIHGIEPKKEQGLVHIEVKQNGQYVQFCIADNGPGIPPDKLQAMLESLQKEEAIGENVGVKNVYYRLKMYYGNQFTFNIESKPDAGTKVCIQLPYKQGNYIND